MSLESINPATGQPIASYPQHTASEVCSFIEQAHQAFVGWRETSFAVRAEQGGRIPYPVNVASVEHAEVPKPQTEHSDPADAETPNGSLQTRTSQNAVVTR